MTKKQLKEFLEVTEAVVTIVVSIAAFGSVIATWESGFFHKVKHIVDYHHAEITKLENDASVKSIEKDM